MLIEDFFSSIFGLFYPDICVCCNNKLLSSEKTICSRCLFQLPETNHYKNAQNTVAKRFYGRVPVVAAAAFLNFKKGGPVQSLIHQLKYKKRQDVGEFLGKMMAHRFMEPNSIFRNIDAIVAVPLHWKKLKLRGYNQCDSIAQSISIEMNVPYYSNALIRQNENISQTKKKRFDRWQNVADIFVVNNQQLLSGKHILLIDDVITTGATSETCLQTILQVPGTSVSFASVAIAVKT